MDAIDGIRLARLRQIESNMSKLARWASGFGCVLSVILPLFGLVLYPRARWLFAFSVIGVVVLVLNSIFRRDPSPPVVADHAQGLLEGRGDVDDYEHLNPRESQLRDLWGRTLKIGGPPEEWIRLDESRASDLRDIIRQMRDLAHKQR